MITFYKIVRNEHSKIDPGKNAAALGAVENDLTHYFFWKPEWLEPYKKFLKVFCQAQFVCNSHLCWRLKSWITSHNVWQ